METKWILCSDSGATNPSLQWCDVKTRNKMPPPPFLILPTHSSFWEVLSREVPCVASFAVLRAILQIFCIDHLSLLSITRIGSWQPSISLSHTIQFFSWKSPSLSSWGEEAWGGLSCHETKDWLNIWVFLRYILWFTPSFMTDLLQLIFLSWLRFWCKYSCWSLPTSLHHRLLSLHFPWCFF